MLSTTYDFSQANVLLAEVVLILSCSRGEENMQLEWLPISEFPDYLVSNQGDVVNGRTGRWIQLSATQKGTTKVGLVSHGKQYTRSVSVLVAEAFVPGRDEIYDTPIHLDGDKTNCRADNLSWRPRWFALAYAKQFDHITDNDRLGPLRDIATDQRYYDIVEAGTLHGLLFKDVRRAIVMKESVFPTIQRFEWV